MRETPKNIQQNNNVALAVWNKNWERKTIGFELRGKAKNRGLSAKGAILVTVSKIKKLVC